jgi:hypothetical protein
MLTHRQRFLVSRRARRRQPPGEGRGSTSREARRMALAKAIAREAEAHGRKPAVTLPQLKFMEPSDE